MERETCRYQAENNRLPTPIRKTSASTVIISLPTVQDVSLNQDGNSLGATHISTHIIREVTTP
jgi:hypothetical protein